MLRLTELKLPVDHAEGALRAAVLERLDLRPPELLGLKIRRRGHDARGHQGLRFVYTLDLELADEAAVLRRHGGDRLLAPAPDERHRYPAGVLTAPEHRPVVVGTGPCGLFAALALAEMGVPPLVLERGRKVRERTQDVWGFWRHRELDPRSNVQFGEGGAGTFSDGKLHTGTKDRGHHGRKILETFVDCGAPPEILYLAKPHIGTLRLVQVVEKLRFRIEALGGEFRFESQATDFEIEDGALRALVLETGERIETRAAVLALGHSARDTFEALLARGVRIEPKPFSIGFRIEHPQAMVDRSRHGNEAGHPSLGAADYKLVHHCANGRSVYSFCMCPGGQVVAATSELGHVVTNGMSHYSRAERNANAGLVVGITPDDFPGDDPLAGVRLQRELEARAFVLGGSSYSAPAQRVGDFLARRPSVSLGEVEPSYSPGVHLCDLNAALPDYAIEALHEAIPALERQLPGFAHPDALLTGVETRTSSPIRIPRTEELQSVSVRGLYPAGEGAGYAGGIMSAAVDGMKVAEALARTLLG